MELLSLESCHSIWRFDTGRMRFQRVMRSGAGRITTEWRPYHALILDPRSEAFTVVLNPEGTRLLRSWRHTGACSQCGERMTAQLSLDATRAGGLRSA